ncbi:hypothetical protein KSW81_005851 [Nannochloris sp. 'desiccata']|nr:hypothetical protein KSW81_005851 [Chlorella desiccata (nom. nud.)]
MLCLDSSLVLGHLPNSMRARLITNSAGALVIVCLPAGSRTDSNILFKFCAIAGERATATAALNKKLGILLNSQQTYLNHRLHTAIQTSAQLRESNEPMATSAAVACEEELLQAAADALDPERTSASLGYTWLTHWQLIEEDRRFRQLAFQSIRGRQQQRQQQLFDLLGVEGANSTDEAAATAYRADAEVRIVHGRLSVVSGAEENSPSTSTSSTVDSDQRRTGELNRTSNEEHEIIDDLTWLASHPEAEATEFSLNFDSTDSNESEAAAAGRMATSGSSSGGGGALRATWPIAIPLSTANSDDINTCTKNNVKQTESELETAAAAVLPGAVQLQLGADVATVRPLWISIYLEESTGTGKLYESVVPLQAEILDKMSNDLTPFCSVSGLEFGALADLRYGPWLNYFVGLVGEVAVEEADILWPNQVLHRDRVLYNVRGASDVAKFLADPRKEDVEAHADNLKRLAEERGYRRGWVWYMLRSRWGERVLKSMGIDPAKM